MGLLDDILNSLRNKVYNALGVNRELREMIKARDIDAARALYLDYDQRAEMAWKEYDPTFHQIWHRPDKQRKGKPPFVVAKTPIPFQQLINEIALTFLFGTPMKFVQDSSGTDNAFSLLMRFFKDTRFNTTIREAKRLAGAETECAKLYHVYIDEEGKKQVVVKVLAHSKGDRLRPLFDQYDRLVSFGHGYSLKTEGRVVEHFDIYFPDVIYRCKRGSIGWDIKEMPNLINKIPVIYYSQNTEWFGTQAAIERVEELGCRVSDTNDYVSDPTLLITTKEGAPNQNASLVNSAPIERSIIDSLPAPDGKEQSNPGKLLLLQGADARYLSVDTAVDLKKNEREDLEKNIMLMSMTPSFAPSDLLKGGALTGRALKRIMALGYMKRSKNMEIYDIAISREINLVKAIIGNVLDISMKAEMDKLEVSFDYGEPFQDDVSEKIQDIVTLKENGLMSVQTALSQIDYVKDADSELDRIQKEKREQEEDESQEPLFLEQSQPDDK